MPLMSPNRSVLFFLKLFLNGLLIRENFEVFLHGFWSERIYRYFSRPPVQREFLFATLSKRISRYFSIPSDQREFLGIFPWVFFVLLFQWLLGSLTVVFSCHLKTFTYIFLIIFFCNFSRNFILILSVASIKQVLQINGTKYAT